ncbi:MAG TPA: YkvA family protein [Anaerolineae bacterium]|nr:YkvA family protein [Anaerolineae bacterium]
MTANKQPQGKNNRNDASFWTELWNRLRLVWYLLMDPETPLVLKIVPVLTMAYVISPIDLIADVIPVLGQFDDITVLLVGLKIFIDMSPPHLVAKHLQALRQGQADLALGDGGGHEKGADEIVVLDDEQFIVDERDGDMS